LRGKDRKIEKIGEMGKIGEIEEIGKIEVDSSCSVVQLLLKLI